MANFFDKFLFVAKFLINLQVKIKKKRKSIPFPVGVSIFCASRAKRRDRA